MEKNAIKQATRKDQKLLLIIYIRILLKHIILYYKEPMCAIQTNLSSFSYEQKMMVNKTLSEPQPDSALY